MLYDNKNRVTLISSFLRLILYYKLSKKEIMVFNLNIVKFALDNFMISQLYQKQGK